MPFVFLSDQRLYEDREHYQKNFDTLIPTLPVAPAGPLLYQCYWIGDRPLGELHLLALRSLAVTQLHSHQVWLWMTKKGIERNRAFIDEHLSELAEVKEIGNAPDAYETSRYRSIITHGDFLRFKLVAEHGGIYFDMDTVFLRDLHPLTGIEFLYQWSDQRCATSAIMKVPEETAAALLARAHEIGDAYPMRLLRYSDETDRAVTANVTVLPSFVFDPCWIARDRHTYSFDDFFTREVRRPVSIEAAFPGSYAYQWHNLWDAEICSGSMGDHLRGLTS